MAGKNAGKGKGGKAGKAGKPENKPEDNSGTKVLGSAAPVAEVNEEAAVDKKTGNIKPTGKCEVVEVSTGKFRIFNENGLPVSPIVGKDDTNAEGKNAYSQLRRQCARMNALQKSRQIRTPVGHKDNN